MLTSITASDCLRPVSHRDTYRRCVYQAGIAQLWVRCDDHVHRFTWKPNRTDAPTTLREWFAGAKGMVRPQWQDCNKKDTWNASRLAHVFSKQWTHWLMTSAQAVRCGHPTNIGGILHDVLKDLEAPQRRDRDLFREDRIWLMASSNCFQDMSRKRMEAPKHIHLGRPCKRRLHRVLICNLSKDRQSIEDITSYAGADILRIRLDSTTWVLSATRIEQAIFYPVLEWKLGVLRVLLLFNHLIQHALRGCKNKWTWGNTTSRVSISLEGATFVN